MIAKLKENFINISLTLLILLIIVNAILIVYNRSVMIENNILQKQTEEVKRNWNAIFESNLRRMDLGLRGYALTKNTGIMGPYYDGSKDMPVAVKRIDSLLKVQHLDSIQLKFELFKPKLAAYMNDSKQMVEYVEQDNIAEFTRVLTEDRGRVLWEAFSPMLTSVTRHQDELVEKARREYQEAMDRNVIFQVILILLTIPTLVGVIYRIRRDLKNRTKLLTEFDQNNRKYMFDPGLEVYDYDPQVIIQSSINNLKKASSFIKSIASENYQVNWDGLTPQNAPLNQENLVGDLVKMRDQMKKVKELDEKRIWSTEGLAKFSDVARNNQNNIEKLSNEVIRFLTKHMKAQQGSLFVLQDEEGEEPHLELKACYAFDKKKFIDKKIDVGSGMVGQAFLEGNTILLTDLPSGYIRITSGLGDATPGCVIIVPMKYNDRVEAVMELASFVKFEQHEVEFLEKAGEVIASSIYATKTNERTAKLLKETQEQAEVLKAQEEELRQNMEEMQATQEDMRRKENTVKEVRTDRF
jgi:CHASE3 domain sensor protein/putative methionine-R-sulfoxide reductase with GAF domain